jgi:hypothetical protein
MRMITRISRNNDLFLFNAISSDFLIYNIKTNLSNRNIIFIELLQQSSNIYLENMRKTKKTTKFIGTIK